MGTLYDGLVGAQDDSQREYLDAAQADYEAEIADLRAQLDECEHPTPPPDSTGSRFGSAINGPLFKPESKGGLGYDSVTVTRVFLRQLPPGSTWDAVVGQRFPIEPGPEALRNQARWWRPELRGIPGDSGAAGDLADGVSYATEALWLSWKEEDERNVDAFLDTMPEDLGLSVWGTFHHEPENDAPGFSAEKFCSIFREHAPVMRDHGVLSSTILMRYTFGSGSGRDWHDWWPGDEYVDIFGCDSYNLANKKGGYSTAADQLRPIAEAAASVDKPWAIGETGASIFNGKSQPRVDWINSMRAEADAQGCLAMAWWDQDSYVFDEPGAAAWLA